MRALYIARPEVEGRINYMWTFTVGTVSGVTQDQVNSTLSVLTDAANYWGRYLSFGGATLDITINFIPLPGTTLAQAGTSFRQIGANLFQAETILELQSGNDQNGAAPDIDIDVDSDSISSNQFYFGGVDDPGPPAFQIDMFTVLIHELGHGLGFLSLFDQPEDTVFDTFLSGPPSALVFTGPNAVDAYGGNVPMDDDPGHLSQSLAGFVMAPFVSSGSRKFLGSVDVRILQDAGLPIRVPTNFNDLIYGFPQNDFVSLLDGDDFYFALAGADTISGNEGADTIFGEDGPDILDGGPGDDRLFGGNGFDHLIGGGDDDSLEGGASSDTLDGGVGSDRASYEDSPFAVTIDLTTDSAAGGHATGDTLISIEGVIGSPFDDIITGADNEDNYINARKGNDLINGLGGNDILIGWLGDDTITGGLGDDTIKGITGNDTLSGNDGNDTVLGGGGDDTVFGNNGNDRVSGGSDNDTVAGNLGDDTLSGENGDDKLYGNLGNDRLIAGAGNDLLLGLGGNDVFFAGLGNDTIFGGEGNDTLNGGGNGDRFVFEPGDGADLLDGFRSVDGDIIEMKGFGAAFDDFSDIQNASSQVGADVFIDLGGGESITLSNISLASLTASDFLFT